MPAGGLPRLRHRPHDLDLGEQHRWSIGLIYHARKNSTCYRDRDLKIAAWPPIIGHAVKAIRVVAVGLFASAANMPPHPIDIFRV